MRKTNWERARGGKHIATASPRPQTKLLLVNDVIVAAHARLRVHIASLVVPQALIGKRDCWDDSSLVVPHACSAACPAQLEVRRSAREQRVHKIR